MTLEHFETTLPKYPLEKYANNYPFSYSQEDTPNLCRALAHHYPPESVRHWASQFLDPSGITGTMDLLRSMTLGIRKQFQYARRSNKGVQSPDETIQSGCGSCRDFAVLMCAAVCAPWQKVGAPGKTSIRFSTKSVPLSLSVQIHSSSAREPAMDLDSIR